MSAFNFNDQQYSVLYLLQKDIAETKDCEGTGSFIDASRKLAEMHYAYFECKAKGIGVRSLIHIQAEIELAQKDMMDFEIFSKNLFNVTFTLRALGIEVEKIQNSIQLIHDEILEFWNAVKRIETQNYKIMKILKSVWKILKDLKESLYVLSKHQKQFIEENIRPSIISFSEYMECTKNEDLNAILKSFGSKSMYFAETLRQMKFMNELLLHHQKLKLIHPLFSFQLILMINDPRINIDLLSGPVKKRSSLVTCCVNTLPKFRKSKDSGQVIKSPEVVLNSIEIQAIQTGTTIHRTTLEIQEVHCASIRRERIVMADVQAKRMVLVRGLNELQNILTAMEELDDFNDTLVGKMTKTRPIFKHINEYLKLDMSKNPGLESVSSLDSNTRTSMT